MSQFCGRKRELESLSHFIHEKGPQLTYLRGRRRVGKSLLLKQFQKSHSHCFYFSGLQDTRTSDLMKIFLSEWEEFSQQSTLSDLKSSALTWNRIFKELTNYLKKNRQTVVFIFDEVQWIAKEKSGFLGSLKNAWDEWQSFSHLKVILCGSSQKFFETKTGNESVSLRGLKTYAEIWVHPFSPKEIKEYFFPYWSCEEIGLLYFLTGGVPYYLNEIGRDLNFIRAVNKAFFTRSTIFLDEVDEILKLEFNRNSQETIKKILKSLPMTGISEQKIIEKTKLPRATVYDSLQKLLDYKIIFSKNKIPRKAKSNQRDERYYLKDFYLNFYFRILQPLENEIRLNDRNLIFGTKVLSSKRGYYIPNYTGLAFELLLETVLSHYEWSKLPLFDKLGLLDPNYQVGTYWEDQTSQIDLVVEHALDRETRLIECKWINEQQAVDEKMILSIREKPYPNTVGHRLSYFLALSQKPSKALVKKALDYQVQLLSLEDLF